jgi:putative ABC transport system ATP-binding protein
MKPSLFSLVILPDARLFALAAVYGIGVSLLTLAVPFSVQVLVETVANTALVNPVVVLAALLFALLGVYGLLNALQIYVMELFERRFFARIASEISFRGLYADHAHLESVHRDDLFNRYFDILTIQKNLPLLLTGGLTLCLQMLIGFVVVSLYHPLFLVFTVAYLGCALLIWRVFDGSARRSAIAVSSAKYDLARWIEGLGRLNLYYKARRHRDFAVTRSDELTQAYVNCHRRHFNRTFAQTVGFLLLYALGSAGLLGVGGWLVVLGELTLGQLVAAELILSAVFAGVTRLGYFLALYYEIVAALDKIGYFYRLPVEPHRALPQPPEWSPEVQFKAIRHQHRGMTHELDFTVPAGQSVMIAVTSSTLIRSCRDLLLGLREPASGEVRLGPLTVSDFAPDELRQEVMLVDAALLPDVSLAEFLGMARPGLTRADIRQALALADIEAAVEALPDGLDTRLMPDGFPLSVSETLRLRVAQAWLARPRVLMLPPLLDAVRVDHRERLLAGFREGRGTTVLYFSNRRDLPGMDGYLLMSPKAQQWVPDLAELVRLESLWLPQRGEVAT